MEDKLDHVIGFEHGLIESWPEPMLLMDGERFIDANPAAVRLLGYADRSSLLGRSPEGISPPFQPDGQLSKAKAREFGNRALSGETLRFEWLHLDALGQEVSVNVTLSPVHSRGRRIVLCAWHDIGALKQAQAALAASEAWFRGFFEKNSSPVMLIDPESGCIVDANQAAVDFYGYPRGILVGMPITDINALPPEQVAEERRRALREERSYFNFPHRLANGDIRNVEVYSTPINGLGRTLLFSIVHDVTERKRAHQALVDANLELERFAHVAAHDLQTPLRSIAGFAHLLQKKCAGRLDGEADQWIGFVVANAVRMQALIQDLLNYSGLESQARPKESVNLGSLLDEVVDTLAPTIVEAGAEVSWDELPTLAADRIQLAQVFQNLIENGLKYNRSGAPRIAISSRRSSDCWILSVADNGIGIAPKHQERIFQIFQRLHSHDAFPGTGIGLATCKRVVENHGGRICVSSEEGRGSTFHFSLPTQPAR